MSLSLPHQTVHLRMAYLAINDDLRIGLVTFLIGLLDSLLQMQHHGASSIYDGYMITLGGHISRGRLTMGTQQHSGITEAVKFLMINGTQTLLGQTLHFHTVVHNVTQTI